MFESLPVPFAVGLLLLSLAALCLSADRLVVGLQQLAPSMGISERLAAIVLLALGTSLPELVVSVEAVREHETAVAISNLLGSNIANALLIGGIGLLISSRLGDSLTKRQAAVVLVMISLPLLGLILRPEWLVMVLLLGGLVGVGYLIRQPGREKFESDESARLAGPATTSIIALVALVVSARFTVGTAVSIGSAMNLNPLFIGGIILAIGTSLPELAATVAALRRKADEVVVGNLLGSILLNVTLMLGITLSLDALIHGGDPLEGTGHLITQSIFAVGLFFLGLKLRTNLRYLFGAGLLLLYAGVTVNTLL